MNIAQKKIKDGFVGQKMIVLPPNIRRNILNNDLISRFHVVSSGFFPHAAYHDRERKTGCSEYILLYCTAGTGTISIADRTIQLTPNHFVILPKDTPHHYKSSLIDPWTIYWLHFTGVYADYLHQKYAELKQEPVFLAYDTKRIEDFERIFSMIENSFEERNLEIVNIKYLNFVSSLLYAREMDPLTPGEDKISRSVLFMKKNPGALYSVQELAAQQNLSVTHYSRLFRAKTGSSPNQYFMEIKVQSACQYLYFTDKSIKEICRELGFGDPFYFSRAFKKLMGVSPVHYRNQHKMD
ncbi:helix-turn-helix domain-containing protein [Arcticibacter sp.]|uniref:AraC family transcriptional regulator n=1 Tax=Arcticibacter sp. TaxID=1872630 RepID=UPI00388EA949